MEGNRRAGNAMRGNPDLLQNPKTWPTVLPAALFGILAVVSAAGILQGAEGPVLFNDTGATFELRPDPDLGTRPPVTLLLVSTTGESTQFFVDFREASNLKILFNPGACVQFPHVEPTAKDQCFWFDIYPENGPPNSEVGYLCFQSYLSIFKAPTVRLRGAFYEAFSPPPWAFCSYGNGLLCLECPAPKPSFNCVVQ